MKGNIAMRILPVLALVLASFSASAAQLYKCKGSSGETIYQNLPCPAGSKILAKGSYERAPDDPSQMRAAAAEASRIRREQDAAAEMATASTYYSAPATTTAQSGSDVDMNKADEKYRADKARWGKRLAGDKPPGYDDRHPRGTASQTAMPPTSRPTYSVDPITQFNPRTGEASHGTRDSDGNVTIFNNRTGESSHGHADGNGNVTLFNPRRGTTTHCNPNGVCD